MDRIKKILILALILFIPAYILGSMLALMIAQGLSSEPITIMGMLKASITPRGGIIIALIWGLFTALAIYIAIKMNLFTMSKMINRVDRAKSDVHGSARFMTKKEMIQCFGYNEHKHRHAKLPTNVKEHECVGDGTTMYSLKEFKNINSHGVVLYHERVADDLLFLLHPKTHTQVIGKTGTGKSASFLAPTIQINVQSKYKPSFVVFDTKGELYEQCSLLMEKNGYNVVRIDLRAPLKGQRYNPLDLIWARWMKYIRLSNEEVQTKAIQDEMTETKTAIAIDITDFAISICPNGGGENALWDTGSQQIIQAVIWAMLYDYKDGRYNMTKEKFTLNTIISVVSAQQKNLIDWLAKRDEKAEQEVLMYGATIVGNPSEKTVGSYLSNTVNKLLQFANEGIKVLTSTSDFSLEELVEKPTAVFFVIPSESKSLHPVATLMLKTIHNYLYFYANEHSEKGDTPTLPRQFYFFLDEFANMPKIEGYDTWVTLDRGYGITQVILIQSRAQLVGKYGEQEAKTIENNMGLQLFLGATAPEDIEYWQKKLGTYTIYNRSANVNDKSSNMALEYEGNTSLTSKDLMSKQQLEQIKAGQNIFVLEGCDPCQGQYLYIKDEGLLADGLFVLGSSDSKKNSTYQDPKASYYDLSDRNARYQAISDGNYDTLYADDSTVKIDDANDMEIEETNSESDEYNDISPTDSCSPEELYNLFKVFNDGEGDNESLTNVKEVMEEVQKDPIYQPEETEEEIIFGEYDDDDILDVTQYQKIQKENSPEELNKRIFKDIRFTDSEYNPIKKINNDIPNKSQFIIEYENAFPTNGIVNIAEDGGYILQTPFFICKTSVEKDNAFANTFVDLTIIEGDNYLNLGKHRFMSRKRDTSQLLHILKTIGTTEKSLEEKKEFLEEYKVLEKKSEKIEIINDTPVQDEFDFKSLQEQINKLTSIPSTAPQKEPISEEVSSKEEKIENNDQKVMQVDEENDIIEENGVNNVSSPNTSNVYSDFDKVLSTNQKPIADENVDSSIEEEQLNESFESNPTSIEEEEEVYEPIEEEVYEPIEEETLKKEELGLINTSEEIEPNDALEEYVEEEPQPKPTKHKKIEDDYLDKLIEEQNQSTEQNNAQSDTPIDSDNLQDVLNSRRKKKH